jgi:hypothetical protein
MRIRPAFAIALLATGLGAPALAAQLPAREVEFVSEFQDPYEIWEGTYSGLATRIIARVGGIYAIRLYDSESPEGYLDDPYGVAAYFVDPPGLEAAVPWGVSRSFCYSSDHCHLAASINHAGRIVGGENYFFPGWNHVRPYQATVDAQTGTVVDLEYLTAPPGFPAPSNSVHVRATAINDTDVIAGYASHDFPTYPSLVKVPIWWPAPWAVAQQLPETPA